MMEWTDRHCRYFHRQFTQKSLLYSEMITADAILHGDKDHLLAYNVEEHPLSLQLGGSDPEKLQAAVKIANDYGYDEYNLNVGCPSNRVQNGRFGACLMQEPELVRACLEAMQSATNTKVTIKCRIGIDDMDDDTGLSHFVNTVKASGVQTFIIHARKAWLKGLSPKQNRQVPPLNYERVYQLKKQNPDLNIILNGGVETIEQTKHHLTKVDGVMMGRAAYHTPYVLSTIDQALFGASVDIKTRWQIAEQMLPYIEAELANGTRLHQITRHMLGLFHGEPGARTYRRILSSEGNRQNAGVEVYKSALTAMRRAQPMQTEVAV